MLNREKYAKQILDIACSGDSVGINKQNMTPTGCWSLSCLNCYFYDFKEKSYESCTDMRKDWWDSEYVEPSIDWSKVPVDTPILVRDGENYEWMPRYFAKFDDNRIYAWRDGSTSWSASGNYDVTRWNYAKLAENEE